MKRVLLISFALILLSEVGIAQPQNGSITWEKEMSIGLEYGPDEPFLQVPGFIATDRQQRIYISDRKALDVKVYSPAGEYLHSIGNSGRGPGEFNEIRTMTMVEREGEQRILVLDRKNARLTEFDLSGEVIETSRIDHFKGVRWPNLLVSSPDSDFLVTLSRKRNEEDMLHLWDGDFQEHRYSFMNLIKLSPEFDEDYAKYSMFDKGNLLVKENAVVYSPLIYLGELFFVNDILSEKPEIRSKKGFIHTSPSVSEVTNPSEGSGNRNYTDQIISYGEEYTFLTHNFSLGLYELSNGHLAHFTAIENEDYMDLGVEIHNSEGELIHYEVIESTPREKLNGNELLLRMRVMDSQKNVYLMRAADNQPVIEKYSFSYKPE